MYWRALRSSTGNVPNPPEGRWARQSETTPEDASNPLLSSGDFSDPFAGLVPDYADKVALAFVALFLASIIAFVVAFYLALSRLS